jgi:hypothetical protein
MARLVIGIIALVAASTAWPAFAQGRPAPVVEVGAGWVGFADDGIVSEGLFGGAARFYLTPRVSVGPEIAYIGGSNHSHLMLTGNVTWDLFAPAGAGGPRVTPFFVAGGGMFQTRESFPRGTFTSTEGAFTGGGGVRVAASDRVTAGVDVRIGWETHIRVNGFVGVSLWR